MKKLFIIGNGFDLAHNMSTSYKDFQKFLKNKYSGTYKMYSQVPEYKIGNHGEILYDDNEVVGYLLDLISRTDGPDWSHLEEALGRLDLSIDFDFPGECYDLHGERNMFYEAYANENLAANLLRCVPMIQRYFEEWVNTIVISEEETKKDFLALINPDTDFFLSFNYTKTLETLYGVKNVCHIHGVQGESLLFGHGEEILGDEYWSSYVGSDKYLKQLHSVLRKNTDLALEEHREFFVNLSEDITKIYSYGFSFGQSDLIYIKEILKKPQLRKAEWYLHEHNKKKHKLYEQILKDCGFQGTLHTFDI